MPIPDPDNPESETTLVARVIAGDTEAFGTLYDRFAPLVRSIVYPAARNSHDVDDLAQEVSVRAHSRLADLKQPERFGSWVAGIARNVFRERCRSKSRDRHDHFSEVPEPEIQISNTGIGNDETEIILRELANLDQRERIAIHAFYLSDKNIEETAQLLNLTNSGAYAMLQRACQRLHSRLKKLEIKP